MSFYQQRRPNGTQLNVLSVEQKPIEKKRLVGREERPLLITFDLDIPINDLYKNRMVYQTNKKCLALKNLQVGLVVKPKLIPSKRLLVHPFLPLSV